MEITFINLFHNISLFNLGACPGIYISGVQNELVTFLFAFHISKGWGRNSKSE